VFSFSVGAVQDCGIVVFPDSVAMVSGSVRNISIFNNASSVVDVSLSVRPVDGLSFVDGVVEQVDLMDSIEPGGWGRVNLSSLTGVASVTYANIFFVIGICEHYDRMMVKVTPKKINIGFNYERVIVEQIRIPFTEFRVDVKLWHVILVGLAILFILWRANR